MIAEAAVHESEFPMPGTMFVKVSPGGGKKRGTIPATLVDDQLWSTGKALKPGQRRLPVTARVAPPAHPVIVAEGYKGTP